MTKFSKEIHDKLDWYVYRLIDPRNGHTFYVGKGRGDRVFAHAAGELKDGRSPQDETGDGSMDLRLSTIRDIRLAGLAVVHVIHRHGLKTSDVAFEVEAALIDAYPGLTNLVSGHGSKSFGCRSTAEIIAVYTAAPLVVPEPAILIHVGKSLEWGRDIYSAVRAAWKMERKRAERYRLVLAEDGVLVLAAYRPSEWHEATVERFPFLDRTHSDRIGFEGVRAEDDVWQACVGKKVPPRKKGHISPFRYVDRAAERLEES